MTSESQHRDAVPRKVRKKRIPKACHECRRSKLKCDTQHPCSRCRVSEKICQYVKPSSDADKIKALQHEVHSLQTRIQQKSRESSMNSINHNSITASQLPSLAIVSDQNETPSYSSLDQFGFPSFMPFESLGWSTPSPFIGSLNEFSLEPPNLNLTSDPSQQFLSHKHNESLNPARSNDNEQSDFVTASILTEEQAETYINLFFRGCGRYFPFADPINGSMHNMREKSIVLFNTMCSIGYRAQHGQNSPLWKALDLHVSKMLDVQITSGLPTIELIQALLIRACYSSERCLLLSMATRLAVEMGLPNSYDELKTQLILGKPQTDHAETLDCNTTAPKLRTWLSILVLRLMLGVDSRTSLDIDLYGDVRRFRILLGKSFSKELDLRLLEQIELNILMDKIHCSIADCARNAGEESLHNAVQNAAVDIDVWFNDWAYILNSQSHENWLRVNIKVQRHWADITTLFWAMLSLKADHLDTSSPGQRNILLMAKAALQQHFKTILSEPQLYIHNLRYATDYVWAKFVFCFLILLETSCLALDNADDQDWKQELVTQGNTLLEELSIAGGIVTGETCSHLSQDYIQLLRSGIDIFSRTTSSRLGNQPTDYHSPGDLLERTQSVQILGGSLVPGRFALEWKFPYRQLYIC